MRGHEEASGTKYYPNGLQDKWKKKDPILKLETEATKRTIFLKRDSRKESRFKK